MPAGGENVMEEFPHTELTVDEIRTKGPGFFRDNLCVAIWGGFQYTLTGDFTCRKYYVRKASLSEVSGETVEGRRDFDRRFKCYHLN